jgi:hypothetical protein
MRYLRVPLLAGMTFSICGLYAAQTIETTTDDSPSITEVKARPDYKPEGDDEFGSIGTNPKAGKFQERIAYFNKALEVSAIFSPEAKSDEKKKKEAIANYTSSDKARSVEMLLACMDSRNVDKPQLRMGAVRALQAAQFSHRVASEWLAYTAVSDPDAEVRNTAVAVVKENKDDQAIGRTVQYLMGAFNEGGQLANPALKANAVAALQGIGDRRVYQALLYHVTMELRVTNTELNNLATRQIDAFTVNNGANATVLVPLSFPIQFPELKVTKVHTTVKCPAVNALEALSGQQFGNDVERWQKWIAGK